MPLTSQDGQIPQKNATSAQVTDVEIDGCGLPWSVIQPGSPRHTFKNTGVHTRSSKAPCINFQNGVQTGAAKADFVPEDKERKSA